jgi:ribosomal protein S27AE
MPQTADERRAYHAAYKRRRYQTDPEYRRKHLARVAANDAVKFRRMKVEPCEACGKAEGVQKHHDDHGDALAVRWLCGDCHGAVHGRARVGANRPG